MYASTRFFMAVLTLLLIPWHSSGQSLSPTRSPAFLKPVQHFDSSIQGKPVNYSPAFMQRVNAAPGAGHPLNTAHSKTSKASYTERAQPLSVPHAPLSLNCIDTSNNIYTREPGQNIGPGSTILKTRDGGLVVPGFHQQISLNTTFPYILKYDATGNVLWSKTFDGNGIYPTNYAVAYKSFELNDGSLLVAGEMLIPEAFNGRYESIFWKLDANGNLIWVHTDSCSIWAQYSGELELTGMVQDPAGNIYLCGNQFAFDAITTHSLVLKMDPLGNVVWDKSFTYRSSQCFGLLYLGGELSVYGTNTFVYMPDGSGNQTNYLWNMRLDPATGDTLRTKCWYPDFGANSGWNSILYAGGIQQLINGNIAVFGTAISELRTGVPSSVHGISAEFDPSFNFLKGWMIASSVNNNNYSYNTRVTEHASGRISYTYNSSYAGYADDDILFGAIEKGQIVKERVIHERGFANIWSTNFIDNAPNEDINIEWLYDSVNNANGLEYLRLHDSDTSSVCTGTDTIVSWLEPYLMLPYPQYRCDSIASNSFRRTNRNIPAPTDGNPQEESACKLLSFCDSVKLFVNIPSACAGQPVVFTCWRNPECGSRPIWTFDSTNLQSASIRDDSTLVLTYKDQFQGKVFASMNGTCRYLSDSVPFKVLPAGAAISLGPDGYLCPDSVLVLRAGKSYGNYTWQDGSAADTLLVQTPGKYYVTASNSCGLPVSDTVLIQQAPLLKFNVGLDSTFCLHDPVLLQAPPGYSGYNWRTNAGSLYNGQTFTVYPPANTTYFASAFTPLGCVVKDTIRITIQVPAQILLGADTSFCSGDSLLLNAGTGFQSYTWNTGGTGASVWVNSKGSYSVMARSPDGCYSKDTIIVNRIYALPVVTLDPQNVICAGSTRTLNAGSGYTSYLWQNGSRSSTLLVDTTGSYWVQVMDNHGCTSGDTVVISKMISGPADFLMADTVICDGYPSKLQSSGIFGSYSWSTGGKGNFITVRKAGSYTLTVADSYGCTGTATIAVTTRQCLFGIFFPNAFTPNKDGVNDVFRPTIYGNITKYKMEIFNRWGQKVFESEDQTKGWDGSLESIDQVSSTFVWICHYQFAGEPEKTENGTMVLLR